MGNAVVIIAIIGVTVVSIAAIALGGVVLRRRMVRRYLLQLIGRREGVRAGIESFASVVRRLAEASDGDLITFALDDASEDRKSLKEIASRMRIDAIELATMALPKELIPIADDLSDAAEVVMEQAEAIAGAIGPAALDALAAVDLASAIRFVEAADDQLARLMAKYHVEDDTVYGGGLYI